MAWRRGGRDVQFQGLDETWLLIDAAIRARAAIVEGHGERELEGLRAIVSALLEPKYRDKLNDRLNELQLEIEKQRTHGTYPADHPRDWRFIELSILLEEAGRGKLLKFERIKVQ